MPLWKSFHCPHRTADIIAAACRALNHVWREGYRYMKAGVMLADFTPSGIAQPGLFDEIQPRKNSEKLMKTLDELNQSGKGKVWFAGRGTAPEWQMKREMLSQCYTTKWRDIPPAGLVQSSPNIFSAFLLVWSSPSFLDRLCSGGVLQSTDVWRPDCFSSNSINFFSTEKAGNDSNLLIVFYVQIMPDDFVMQLHRF